jgi:hypothetical protein
VERKGRVYRYGKRRKNDKKLDDMDMDLVWFGVGVFVLMR